MAHVVELVAGVVPKVAKLPVFDAVHRLADLTTELQDLVEGIADRLGAKSETVGGDRPIDVDDTHVGGGYGMPTPASTEALELFARREGILLDPVYTSKAMAALLDDIRDGKVGKESAVVFVHTGGAPALFAYVPDLMETLA